MDPNGIVVYIANRSTECAPFSTFFEKAFVRRLNGGLRYPPSSVGHGMFIPDQNSSANLISDG